MCIQQTMQIPTMWAKKLIKPKIFDSNKGIGIEWLANIYIGHW